MTNPTPDAILAPFPNPVAGVALPKLAAVQRGGKRGVRASKFAMTRRLTLGVSLALVAAPLQAQSLVFPRFFDQHVPHLLTKPAIAVGITTGLKQLGVPKGWAVVCGLVCPTLVSAIRTEILYPGSIRNGWFWKDKTADTIAAATILLPLHLKGPARGLTFSAGVMLLGGGLHKWGKP